MTNPVQALCEPLERVTNAGEQAGHFGYDSQKHEIREVAGRWGRRRRGRKGGACPSACNPTSLPLRTFIRVPLAAARECQRFPLCPEAQKAQPLESYKHIHTNALATPSSHTLLFLGGQQRGWPPLPTAQGWFTGTW